MTLSQTMEASFAELEARLDTLVDLLTEAEERHWQAVMRRAATLVRHRNMNGASLVLSAFGAAPSFSALVLAAPLPSRNPARHVILNHKLEHLRTSIFVVAAELASATTRGRLTGRLARVS